MYHYEVINKIFYILFFLYSLWNPSHLILDYLLATFQILNKNMGFMAIILENIDVNH